MNLKKTLILLWVFGSLNACSSKKTDETAASSVEKTNIPAEQGDKEMTAQQHLEVSDSLIKLYVAENNMDTLVTSTGIIYEYMKKNPSGRHIKFMDEVTVKYKGTLLDGTEFDNGQIDFIAGGQQVIRGWDEAIQLMRDGEKIKAIIPWYQAYGDQATGPIPPFSDLVFEMEVIKSTPSKDQD